MKKLVLIDGNALVHRAFHALPPLKAPNGMVANAVFGFTSVLIKMIKDIKPEYIAATFDLAGPTFRHEEYDEYKAHREKAPDDLYAQMPIIKDVLKSFGVPIYEQEGFEADDLIGTLSKKGAKEKDVQVVILTGDLDTLQLVDGKKVVVYTFKRGMSDTVIYDEKGVKDRYDGLLPGQVVDYKGLKGDSSDNIPGVPGVGEKTAIMLIKEFGNMEEMYKKLGDEKIKLPKGISEKLKQKLIDNENQAIFSKKLATIVTDMDISFSLGKTDWAKNLDMGGVEKIFKDLAFSSLSRRVSELKQFKQGGLFTDEEPKERKKKTDDVKKVANSDLESKIKEEEAVSIVFGEDNIYVYLEKGDVTYEVANNFDIKSLLENKKVEKVVHHLKNDAKYWLKEGIEPKNVFDTAIASYLILPDQKDYDLEKVHYQEFQESLPLDVQHQAKPILRLKDILWEKLKEHKLIKIFQEMEMPLITVLAEMEAKGIKIDTKSLKKLSKTLDEEIQKLEKKIFKLSGTEFNISSPQQLSEVLFNKLELKGKVRKTSGGVKSTAAPELEKLIDEHPVIEPVLQYRELQKLKTTYVDPFPELVGKDERVHTTYNQMGTGTGRISSENPNLQNIPIKTDLGQEFRKAFIADKGYSLISCDYSQIELRMAAHLSGDEKMIQAFKEGKDIHTATAIEIFEVKPEDVTSNMRRQAKVVNFGIIYGMGILGLARAIGFDRTRAREFITKYLNEFPGIKEYMDKMKEEVKKHGFVKTTFGRRRKITEVFTSMPQVISHGERMAINFPIQGGNADIMKMSMIKIHELIEKGYKKNEVRMLLQVHDELLFEVKDKYVQEFSKKAGGIMEGIAELKVPLVVDIKSGPNWAELELKKN